MTTWLIQPTKIEQEKLNYLMDLLDRVQIPFEIVYPLKGQILNQNKEKFIFQENIEYFVCGSYPLTRLVFEKRPDAVFSLEKFSFDKIWDIFGKENFVNDDAKVCHTSEIKWNIQEEYFVRPLEDTKSFNGGIYNKHTLQFNGQVTIASLKHISREHRFFIIDGEIVTASLYKVNGFLEESDIIDEGALKFAEEMIKKFTYEGYVIDIATINNQYKIMELNCLNAAGFYKINISKLVMAVEGFYENKQIVNMKSKKSI